MSDRPLRDPTGPDIVTIMLTAAFVMLLTISVSSTAWWVADRPTSEWPAWIEAGATVAAVGAAIVAGFYAARAFGLEFRREEHWEDARRSAQAVRVAAWPTEPQYRHEVKSDAHGYAMHTPVALTGVLVQVRNASDLPIEQVTITAHIRLPLGVAGDPPVGKGSVARIAPETTVDLVCAFEDAELPMNMLLDREPDVRVNLRFVDAAGRTWRRGAMFGDLVQVGSPTY